MRHFLDHCSSWFTRMGRRLAAVALVAPIIGFGAALTPGLGASVAQAKPSVSDVRAGIHEGDVTRFVLEISENVDFRILTLGNPYRVVVDLPDLDWGHPELGKSVGAIQAMRYGLFQPGTGRIVLDMKGPVLIDKAFVISPRGGRQWRFVLDMRNTDAGRFVENRSLEVNAPRATSVAQASSAATTSTEPTLSSAVLLPNQGGLSASRNGGSLTQVPPPEVAARPDPAGQTAAAQNTPAQNTIVIVSPSVNKAAVQTGTRSVSMPLPPPVKASPPVQSKADTAPIVEAKPVLVAKLSVPPETPPETPPATPVTSPEVSAELAKLKTVAAPDAGEVGDGFFKPVAPTMPAQTRTKVASLAVPPLKSEPAKKPFAKPLIVIDPGHGGVDPGALGISGIYEKHITLAAARAAKAELEKTGRYRVKLTRDRDIFIPLRDRVRIGRDSGADLFVSLHADSHGNPNTRGLSVYTLSEKASDSEAAALAEKENKVDLIAGIDLSTESSEVTNILIDLAQRETMNQSAAFANVMVGELGEVATLLNNTHRFAGFAVLKAPDIPSVLVELGYLSNRDEEPLLRQPRYRAKLAKALARSVDHYFLRMQKATR